jgi:hypothetical protein
MGNSVKYDYQFRLTPAVQASAYTANRMLCAPFTISGPFVPPNLTAAIKSITIVNLAASAPALDFIFFKDDVAITNGINQSCNVSNADLQNHVTFVEQVGTGAWISDVLGSGTIRMATVHPSNLTVNSSAAGVVKVAVLTRTAITPASVSDFTIVIDFEIL